ncbi:MAG: hypothetical protein A3I75_07050 [Deltaproteobacteria bacterium RIFCSPLOWO2_02_FULL_50_16]|nr:MAG: hypothetical protein A2053_00570 [Deltaproteobacteria bacterium GWA2_50_8]OGQ26981.1 MAG: hypothetical protein A3B79_03215 [Deltaproteobacteria bacterium RIFCSPHIGHO2_02_FULL_50_15]OGQ56479.1 MAG: hypothetical protein A3I75_07050 [Deltaproteobacteria bacterium RIFCSPLOWO2_02_FULL_50_16]OGQ68916.1 MAG: hypothetical protein A3F89_02720 [Deltaproteobacteria bacterium RIFCSPLOWO2_12_FULL_50_11]
MSPVESQFHGVNVNVVKTEARVAQMGDPMPIRRGKGFGTFLQAMGSFLGPVGMAAGMIVPGAQIGGLAAYGVAGMGSHIRNRASESVLESKPMPVSFPGMGGPASGGGIQPVAFGSQSGYTVPSGDALDVITQRNGSTHQMIHSIGNP